MLEKKVSRTSMSMHKRQTAIFNPEEHSDATVTVIGLGNIGSHATLALAKMGIRNFIVYDFDTVEEHNIASQSYVLADIGAKKTDAISNAIQSVNPDANIEQYDVAFDGAHVSNIVVCAVDSLSARRTIAERVPRDAYIIDGRMGGGQLEVHAQLATEWASTIPETADTDPCSARYISYTSYMIAGVIANTVKRLLCSQRDIKRFIMHTETYDSIVERYDTE